MGVTGVVSENPYQSPEGTAEKSDREYVQILLIVLSPALIVAGLIAAYFIFAVLMALQWVW